jgi:hypothetical protein
MKSIRTGILVGALSAFALVACSGQGPQPTPGTTNQAWDNGGGGNNGGGGGAQALSCTSPVFAVCADAQSVAIARAVFQGHLAIAQAVVNSVVDSDVKALAQSMIDNYTRLTTRIDAIVSDMGITLQENGLSHEITIEAQAEVLAFQAMIKAQPAPAPSAGSSSTTTVTPTLDESFVDFEILSQMRDINVLDRVLLASAQDQRLVTFFTNVREALSDRASLLVQVETKLEGACGAQVTTCQQQPSTDP